MVEDYPDVWGPHFWFFLHTITFIYPNNPTDTIKKRFYELVQNIPLFLPGSSVGCNFLKLLDKYPVQPYLSSRSSFIRWMHFIHNKLNKQFGKPTMKMDDFLSSYWKKMKPPDVKNKYNNKWKKIAYIATLFIGMCVVGYVIINK